MSIEELLKGKREEILRLTARYGPTNVRGFGSVAPGRRLPGVLWRYKSALIHPELMVLPQPLEAAFTISARTFSTHALTARISMAFLLDHRSA